MASSSFFHLLLFFLLFTFASSTTLSDNIFEYRVQTGRTLLQQTADCNIDFENQNYTIITSQCKGPNYQAKACCGALKELACPFRDQLNDPTNDCSPTLFSYINLYGKYPPGLFSNLCREDKQGLDCRQVTEAQQKKQQEASSAAAAAPKSSLFTFLIIIAATFSILF